MERVQASIGNNFPVNLRYYSDGTVMLVPQYNFNLIIDRKPEGITGMFDGGGFTLVDNNSEEGPMECQYHTPYKYKEMPVLKAWLVQQQMVSPI